MRTLLRCAVFFGLLTAGCDRGRPQPLNSFAAPTSVPVTPAAPTVLSDRYTQITPGDVLNRRVTTDDPLCVGFPEFRCQYFRITADNNGLLEAGVMTIRGIGGQLQDVSVLESGGADIWGLVGGQVSIAMTPGKIYQITVWYAEPGVEFELRTSIRPTVSR